MLLVAATGQRLMRQGPPLLSEFLSPCPPSCPVPGSPAPPLPAPGLHPPIVPLPPPPPGSV
eukprot:3407720-Rhodomonas_salina.1